MGIGRRFFDLSTRITGPVFNRIWNTPNNGYAQKFKHVIEPIAHHFARDRDRQLQQHRQARMAWITSSGQLDQLRASEPSVREEAILARDSERLRFRRATTPTRPPRNTISSWRVDTRRARRRISIRWCSRSGRRRPTRFRATSAPTGTQRRMRCAHLRLTAGSTSPGCRRTSAGRRGGSSRGWRIRQPAVRHRTTSRRTRPSAVRAHRIGGTYSFNYDLKHDSFLQQRLPRTTMRSAAASGSSTRRTTCRRLGRELGVAAGSSVQFVVHAGGHRHVLEPVRRVRRQQGR